MSSNEARPSPTLAERLANHLTIRGLAEDAGCTYEWLGEVIVAAITDVGGVEYAVEERTDLDGPWDRIDDGRGWSGRRGRPYSKAEARASASRRVNGTDPSSWRRVVRRTISGWEPVDA